jgi:hypothetical protein
MRDDPDPPIEPGRDDDPADYGDAQLTLLEGG